MTPARSKAGLVLTVSDTGRAFDPVADKRGKRGAWTDQYQRARDGCWRNASHQNAAGGWHAYQVRIPVQDVRYLKILANLSRAVTTSAMKVTTASPARTASA